jgi:hypothetical protein
MRNYLCLPRSMTSYSAGLTGSEAQLSLVRRAAKYTVNTLRFWDNAADLRLFRLTTRG